MVINLLLLEHGTDPGLAGSLPLLLGRRDIAGIGVFGRIGVGGRIERSVFNVVGRGAHGWLFGHVCEDVGRNLA